MARLKKTLNQWVQYIPHALKGQLKITSTLKNEKNTYGNNSVCLF
jgi:hypothetical protein